MSKVAVVTDSTAYLPPDYVKKNDLRVVPLKVHWGEEQFDDGVDITPAAFYTRLAQNHSLPTTSQPPTQAFLDAFQSLAKDYDQILVLPLSSGISGTASSAQLAASMFAEIPVEVVDTLTVGPGAAIVVQAAVHALQQGKDVPQVKAIIQEVRQNSDLYFAVDTLEYLHKGGRIGGASRYFGTALNIKPILFIDEHGKIEAHGRVRTKPKVVSALIDLIAAKSAGQPAYVGICHAQVPELATELAGRLSQQLDCRATQIFDLSPVIGTHVGPGTVGIAVSHASYISEMFAQ